MTNEQVPKVSTRGIEDKFAQKTSIILPPKLDAELRQAAKERDWKLSTIVRRAVEFYLENLLPVEDVRYTKDPTS